MAFRNSNLIVQVDYIEYRQGTSVEPDVSIDEQHSTALKLAKEVSAKLKT